MGRKKAEPVRRTAGGNTVGVPRRLLFSLCVQHGTTLIDIKHVHSLSLTLLRPPVPWSVLSWSCLNVTTVSRPSYPPPPTLSPPSPHLEQLGNAGGSAGKTSARSPAAAAAAAAAARRAGARWW